MARQDEGHSAVVLHRAGRMFGEELDAQSVLRSMG